MAAILVLGGTSWLGGAVAARARDEGHEVTCLARGESGAVPEGVRFVPGNRGRPDAYDALPAAGLWDLVVDVARQPGHVRGAVSALSERAANWAFVSSCSVYAGHNEHGADEAAELLPVLHSDEASAEQYGEGKVACEAALAAARGDRALVARAGLIVGKGDPSERFGYWVGRFALSAEDREAVLVPANAEQRVQWVDVDDLSRWLLHGGLSGLTGTFNATGPAVSLATVLDAAAGVAGHAGQRVSANVEQLAAEHVDEFMGPRSLPLWLRDPDWQAFMDRDVEKARKHGLAQRPLTYTLVDCLAWERELGLGRRRSRAGLDRADELAIIERLAV